MIGKLFHTTDGGETWKEIFNEDGPAFWTFMAFSPTNTNALLGGSNSLYVNTDAEELVVTSSLKSTIKQLSEFTLSPNPAKDEITVDLVFDSHTSFQLNIINVLGSIQQTMNFESKELHTTFNLQSFLNGSYFIQIVSKEGFSIQKFVKL